MTRPQNSTSEVVLGTLVIGLLALLFNPYWMPMGGVLVLIGLLAVGVFGFGVFVWRESAKDEREQQIIAQNDRLAYLIAGGIMTVGVATQAIQGSVDAWLVGALAGMVIIKIITSIKRQK